MKKVFLIGILTACTMCVSAQCVEVKGVECNKTKKYNDFICFHFSNKNKYQVTVEIELWRKEVYIESENKRYPEALDDTKTIILNADDDYKWKINMRGYHDHDYYVKFKVFKCPE